MIPYTPLIWIKEIKTADNIRRKKLIEDRPIVVWFHKYELSVLQLIMLPHKDLSSEGFENEAKNWIIQGRTLFGKRIHDITDEPQTLDFCLTTLGGESDWVICEFPHEIAFYHAATEYLLQDKIVFS